ncbi:MAG TPA: hypothetical protein VGX78_05845 [Pirellulales bacterium]|jgi:hypothetical protein|nr:hypothetical protein [Pirellulales bacterium]
MLRLPCVILYAAACLAAASAPLAGEPPRGIAPCEGLLLLKNGGIIAGKITAAGDYYHVLEPIGETRVRAAEVEMQCSDLDEAYRRKREKIKDGKPSEHLDLAEWCVRHALFGRADDELATAAAADPSLPRLELIARRLQHARRNAEVPRAPALPASRGPTNDDLERMARGIPKATMMAFTSTIQPLLLNNCSSSGCHTQRSGGKLQLQRIDQPSKGSTRRNLYSVLQCVDAADPLASALLKVPIERHGNAKAPIFTNREAEQYRQLVAWVQSVHGPRQPSRPSAGDKEAPPLSPRAPSRRTADDDSAPPTDLAEAPPHMADEMPALDVPSAADAEPSAPATPYVPRDPFDPEVFNRRYFPPGRE